MFTEKFERFVENLEICSKKIKEDLDYVNSKEADSVELTSEFFDDLEERKESMFIEILRIKGYLEFIENELREN